MNPLSFFQTLYQGCKQGAISVMMLPDKRLEHISVLHMEEAVSKLTDYGQSANAYFGVGLRREDMPSHSRGGAAEVISIPCFFADIDVAGEAHKQQALPQTKEEAVVYLHALPEQPSIIVDSGHGLQAYWLFDEPFHIHNEEDRQNIMALLFGFGLYIRKEGTKHGWNLDPVFDIARMLRAPGTINYKNGQRHPCEVIEASKKRYSGRDFEQYRHSVPIREEIPNIDAENMGEAERIFSKCNFMRHCKNEATILSEPEWHAAICNLALTSDGETVIHEISRPYNGYSREETENRRLRAIKERKPHTCQYIRECLGFTCPKDGCGVKAPVALAVLSMDERLQLLMTSEVPPEEVLSDKTLALLAYAKEQRPAEYIKFKLRLKPLGIGIRDFERAVKSAAKQAVHPSGNDKFSPLSLEGLDASGAVVPRDWLISLDKGLQKFVYINGFQVPVTVSATPVIITKRLENIDSGLEKVELAFYRNRRWKHIVAPRSAIFNKTTMIRFADSGISVTSDTAGDLVKFLSEYETANADVIPFVRSIGRIGWFGGEFYPYQVKSEVVFESEYNESSSLAQSLHKQGDYGLWLKTAASVRRNPLARAILDASFASVLLEPLKQRVILTHLWCDSRGGKTAVLKLALSIWGDPLKLMGSFNTTLVGLERMAGTLKHLPLGLDELQMLNERRLSAGDIIYNLGNGYGRTRGAKNGGLQEISSWRNTVISTGEMPISKDASMDGVLTRAMEFYGKPVEDIEFAKTIHQVSEISYGHAGEAFIAYMVKELLPNVDMLRDQLNMFHTELKASFDVLKLGDAGIHLDNVAVLSLADFYASISVFSLEASVAQQEALNMGLELLKNVKSSEKEDTVQRAWEFVTGWVASNRKRFGADAIPCFGEIKSSTVYILTAALHDALETAGFSYTKSVKGFKERGYIETIADAKGIQRSQIQRRIQGVNARVFPLKLDVIGGGDTFHDEIVPLARPPDTS